MNAHDHHALSHSGVPPLTLVMGVLLISALAGLLFGIPQWRKTGGKIAVIASTLVLLALALVTALVLITVWSGSMG